MVVCGVGLLLGGLLRCCWAGAVGFGLGLGCDWPANGSVYCWSPAPSCARAAAGARATARLTATAAMRRGAGTPRDGSVAPRVSVPRHILVLTDRDWTHPEAGGTGTVLYGQVSRWVAWGHRVTVIAGDYPGAERVSHLDERLTVHRMGTRLTVFPRAAWATFRGLGRDADVVLEVCNGIAFFTSLWRWMRKPRVLLVFHVHQEHYVTELGLRGRVAAFLLEQVPLQIFYPGVPVITISQSSREDLVALGVERERIHVVYCGLDSGLLAPGPEAPEPTLIYLGRLKQYKRIELLFDVLDAIPEAHLDLAGDGDHRAALEAEVERRALAERVTFHGHVDEEEKARLLARAWVALTASSAEGWCLTVFEAAACGTPTAAMRVGGLGEAIVDGQTGVLADEPAELVAGVRELVAAARAARGARPGRPRSAPAATRGTPRRRARSTVMDGAMAAKRSGLRASARALGLRQGRGARGRHAGQQRDPARLHRRLHATARPDGLRHAGRAHLGLPDPARGRAVRAACGRARGGARPPRPPRGPARDAARLDAPAARGAGRRDGGLRAPARAARRAHRGAATCRGRPRPSRPPACCGCCSRCSAARCRGCAPTARSASRSSAEAAGRLVCGLILVGVGLGVTGALLGTPLAFVLVALWLERELVRVVGPRAARLRAAAHAALARGRRLGADHRPVPARLAAERRRDPRQAPARRRRRRLLRGGGGGGEGGGVGGDRRRTAPAARGDPARGGRARSAAGAAARARDPRGRRRPGAAHLRRGAQAAAAPGLRARASPTPPTRCCSSAPR